MVLHLKHLTYIDLLLNFHISFVHPQYEYKVMFIDDGSNDGTLNMIKKESINARNIFVSLLNMSLLVY